MSWQLWQFAILKNVNSMLLNISCIDIIHFRFEPCSSLPHGFHPPVAVTPELLGESPRQRYPLVIVMVATENTESAIPTIVSRSKECVYMQSFLCVILLRQHLSHWDHSVMYLCLSVHLTITLCFCWCHTYI